MGFRGAYAKVEDGDGQIRPTAPTREKGRSPNSGRIDRLSHRPSAISIRCRQTGEAPCHASFRRSPSSGGLLVRISFPRTAGPAAFYWARSSPSSSRSWPSTSCSTNGTTASITRCRSAIGTRSSTRSAFSACWQRSISCSRSTNSISINGCRSGGGAG